MSEDRMSETGIRVEEVTSVEAPPKARVADAETAPEKLERKRDYLEGFLAAKPAAVAPSAVGFRLRFPSKEPTPLATFTRDGVVWVVLERRLALDVSQIQARQRELGPSDVTAIETPVSATVLRLAPPMRSSVGVLREGWEGVNAARK